MFERLQRIARSLVIAPLLLIAGGVEANAQVSLPRDMDGDDFAWFYNKPGVSHETYRNDEALCAIPGRPRSQVIYAQGIVPGLIASAMIPGMHGALRDNCMIASGYRRFEIRPGNQRTFTQGPVENEAEFVASYVSSDSPPEGVLALEYRNEFMSPNAQLFAAEVLETPAPTRGITPGDAARLNLYYLRGRTVDELAPGQALDPSLATVVLAMTTADGHRGRFNTDVMAFLRVGADSNVPLTDRHPTFINLGQWNRDREPERFQIFQVPAGRYALWRFSSAEGRHAEFCIRTFAFDVQAGDVVYGGRWISPVGTALDVRIDDIEGARNTLRQVSPTAADAMELATFRNGVRLPCSDYYVPGWVFYYAVDLPVRAE